MASVFTFDPDPPRVSSPWPRPGSSTSQPTGGGVRQRKMVETETTTSTIQPPLLFAEPGIRKLEAEPQAGPTEYKLHLLLRPRRSFIFTSTNPFVSGSNHSKARLSTLGPSGSHDAPDTIENTQRPLQAPSNQTRQHRLQQLTTQLLWRLQQSSPYHSSSTADLVLPILPEASPQLHVPKVPAHLAGLEESQGALYEIGVSDDGTFVGLATDELDESLTNLRAMAASLGCRVQILRKVVVGSCTWSENRSEPTNGECTVHSDSLWVAEALIKPDLSLSNEDRLQAADDRSATSMATSAVQVGSLYRTGGLQSRTTQLRVSVTGATTSGKSSLIGTLSTSTLDNGRGKSRLSLLKHRHEIASGVTSSVAQELVGYWCSTPDNHSEISATVVNYASGNVSSWNDIHAGSEGANGRLTFISDSAGHPRYQKTILRSLISWNPHWSLLCIAADEYDNTGKMESPATTHDVLGSAAAALDLSSAHLHLCLQLALPLVIVITKLDLASKAMLRQNLARVLSAVKVAGRKPVILSNTAEGGENGLGLQQIGRSDDDKIIKVIQELTEDGLNIVPIVFTSSVNGRGIGKVHSLLKSLPIIRQSSRRLEFSPSLQHPGNPIVLFQVDEVFSISPSKIYTPVAESSVIGQPNTGIILSGYVRYGEASIGDELLVGPLSLEIPLEATSAELGPLHSSSPDRAQLSKHVPAGGNSPKHKERHLCRDFLTTAHGSANNRQEAMSSIVWLNVRVVSLRNLRLPVRKLVSGQVGTVGIETVSSQSSDFLIPENIPTALSRVRKGHILARFKEDNLPHANTGIIASFPSTNRSSLSVGMPVTLYTASIRLAAKIVDISSLILQSSVASGAASHSPSPNIDMPNFDGQGPGQEGGSQATSPDGAKSHDSIDINVTLFFVSSAEWVEIGTKVLVMPVSGSSGSGAGSTGLEGFVGRIEEALG